MPKKLPADLTTKAATNLPPAFEAVIDAFNGQPGITRGSRFGSVTLSSGGKIFAMYYQQRFIAKLPRERVMELIAQGAQPFEMNGRATKEWVALNSAPELAPETWPALAQEAQRFVTSSR